MRDGPVNKAAFYLYILGELSVIL